MKKFIPLMMLVSLMMWGCKQGSNNNKEEEMTSEEQQEHVSRNGVLSEEEIEKIVSFFSIYLKDSIDEAFMNGAISNAEMVAQVVNGEGWDEALYHKNIDKVDSLMKRGIRLAKANDYDRLLDLVENMDMTDFYMHPSNTVENEFLIHTAFALIYGRAYKGEEFYLKFIPLAEYSKSHFDMLAMFNPRYRYHELRPLALRVLADSYTRVGRYAEAIATCKEYVELMKEMNPEDDTAISFLADIYDEAGLTAQRDSCLNSR